MVNLLHFSVKVPNKTGTSKQRLLELKAKTKDTNDDVTEKHTDVGSLRVYLSKPTDRILSKTMKKEKE